MASYYDALSEGWNSGVGQGEEVWEPCKRCYGTGEDDDGADCIHCAGYGEVRIR